jgi:hypothetical protein
MTGAQLVVVEALLYESTTTVGQLDEALRVVEPERDALRQLERELIQQLPDQRARLSRFEQRRAEDLLGDLQALRDGVTADVGVRDSQVAKRLNMPGLRALERVADALRTKRGAVAERMERWPTPSSTCDYRYTGPEFKGLFGGRYLLPGDVVALTEAQATAFRDRFERVVPNS